ncbi:cysteine desulfurase, NifS family [Oceanispirochaeta crateris]|uniref:cysteine desulfurase n=1 Tax=Oceanispirochaeta crateris TaxID=2518645 RepID=A0A5C1QNX0_9SPIO|nr:NifS family cysteine desulfurase [Oceanispirochaeta crateris]QEN09217.1 cysteine desulfurase, NifS family [Oceanispirochaeta crateris]
MERIYLDSNATTVVDPLVKQAMDPFYCQMYGNPNSLHRFGTETHPAMSIALDRMYKAIDADDEDDIIINGCATEGNNTVLKSVFMDTLAKGEPCHIITSQIEHPSVLKTCQYLEKEHGIEVTYLPVNKDGLVTLDSLKAHLVPGKTSLVSIMWANNETGLINPIKELAEYTKQNGVLFHTDAVQAVGKIPVSLKEVPADYLTFSAHKFHGPIGVGGMYIRHGNTITPLLHGGEQMGHKRAGTVNVPFVVGMGLAIELASQHLDYIDSDVRRLRNKLEDAILALPDTIVIGDRKYRTPNTILASFKGIEGEAFLWDLNQNGIAASTGSACSSEELEADATFQAMDMDNNLSHTGVRFSLSRFTTEEEIDVSIEVINKTVQRLRAISSTY